MDTIVGSGWITNVKVGIKLKTKNMLRDLILVSQVTDKFAKFKAFDLKRSISISIYACIESSAIESQFQNKSATQLSSISDSPYTQKILETWNYSSKDETTINYYSIELLPESLSEFLQKELVSLPREQSITGYNEQDLAISTHLLQLFGYLRSNGLSKSTISIESLKMRNSLPVFDIFHQHFEHNAVTTVASQELDFRQIGGILGRICLRAFKDKDDSLSNEDSILEALLSKNLGPENPLAAISIAILQAVQLPDETVAEYISQLQALSAKSKKQTPLISSEKLLQAKSQDIISPTTEGQKEIIFSMQGEEKYTQQTSHTSLKKKESRIIENIQFTKNTAKSEKKHGEGVFGLDEDDDDDNEEDNKQHEIDMKTPAKKANSIVLQSSSIIQNYIDSVSRCCTKQPIISSETSTTVGLTMLPPKPIYPTNIIDSAAKAAMGFAQSEAATMVDRHETVIEVPVPFGGSISLKEDSDVSREQDIVIDVGTVRPESRSSQDPVKIEENNHNNNNDTTKAAETAAAATAATASFQSTQEMIIKEYRRLFTQLGISCSLLERTLCVYCVDPNRNQNSAFVGENHQMMMSARNSNCFSEQCVAFVRIDLKSSVNPLIGKNVMQVVLIPFVKVFNMKWLLKKQQDSSTISWTCKQVCFSILKMINIIWMMILTSLYLAMLVCYLLVVLIVYFILRVGIAVILLPICRFDRHRRISFQLSDVLSSLMYHKQQTYTYVESEDFSEQAEFLTAKALAKFHLASQREKLALLQEYETDFLNKQKEQQQI